ncbi:FxsA family protein [Kingella negevensis]|uniref:Phage T7 F exclusion suppressor FxsA n=1 Tax=Kingella negevensis TaxID=1522312 RepID=A0A238HF65_9NEIS|nr:FxsA family protein [Kingella negevensis]MDK4680726.1 FxsA family protein [Kingella negevensis]MDK4681551.1 FxsA family protein [Kingella negevensis]MDK4691938.1 FxsA family protein [Kingella negevensis]MDK4692909.1 FxsA family protein [Kingella negevensis]MDK4697667.1 FxsA family protein [Kingella negevensis]
MQYLGITLLFFIFLEIFSIAFVSKAIGGLAAFGLIILFFMLGSFIMQRSAGLSKLMMAGGLFKSGGRLSFYQMLYPVRIPFAAFLLMMPGFFSDLIALILLLPFGSASSDDNASTTQQSGQFSGFQYQTYRSTSHANDDVIEGEFTVKNGKTQPEKRSVSDDNIIEHKP